MIETKAYDFSKNQYMSIIMRKYFEKRTWTLVLLFILIIFYFNFKDLFKYDDIWGYILICAPIINVLYFFFLVRFNLSRNLADIFLETNMSFDEIHLFFVKNDNEVKIPYKNIKKVENAENYWLVYISKVSFIYIPKNIFYSEEDQHAFKKYIRA